MDRDHKIVTICSDDPAFGSALRILLSHHDVQIVPKLSEVSGDAAIVVYKDDGDPSVSNLLAEVAETTPTLVLADPKFLMDSIDAGSRGFLPSSASLEEIQQGIDVILQGGALVPPDLLGTLLRHLVERQRRTADPTLDTLTDREWQVFHLAAQGLRKDEIAEKLFISPATARTHLQRVYRKLGISSQAELVAVAARAGHLDIEGDL